MFDAQYGLLNWHSIAYWTGLSLIGPVQQTRHSNWQQQSCVGMWISCFSLSLINSCSFERSRLNHFRFYYCTFHMLFCWPFVVPNPIWFDVKPLSMKFSFALLSLSDSYYLSLRICTNLGEGCLSLIRLPLKIVLTKPPQPTAWRSVPRRPSWGQRTPVASTQRSKWMDRSLRLSQASNTWAQL